MNMKRTILTLGLILACWISAAYAESRFQYFVGYGIYPPSDYFSTNTTSQTVGTGLLHVNGTHHMLVQLISAGANNVIDAVQWSSPYVSGDDTVLDSRIVEAGTDGTDEWGFSHLLPSPFVTTNSDLVFVYVRVFQDTTLELSDWYYDTSLIAAEEMDATPPMLDIFAQVINIETSGDSVPAQGVCLDKPQVLEGGTWYPHTPETPVIRQCESNPTTVDLDFTIPYSYSLLSLLGADSVLPDGGWNWQTLVEGTNYVISNNTVTILIEGETLPDLQIIRARLNNDF